MERAVRVNFGSKAAYAYAATITPPGCPSICALIASCTSLFHQQQRLRPMYLEYTGPKLTACVVAHGPMAVLALPQPTHFMHHRTHAQWLSDPPAVASHHLCAPASYVLCGPRVM